MCKKNDLEVITAFIQQRIDNKDMSLFMNAHELAEMMVENNIVLNPSTEKTNLVKHQVCVDCHSVGIQDIDCRCTYMEFETIELEFEECNCCGNLIDDSPADTKFNNEQFSKQK